MEYFLEIINSHMPTIIGNKYVVNIDNSQVYDFVNKLNEALPIRVIWVNRAKIKIGFKYTQFYVVFKHRKLPIKIFNDEFNYIDTLYIKASSILDVTNVSIENLHLYRFDKLQNVKSIHRIILTSGSLIKFNKLCEFLRFDILTVSETYIKSKLSKIPNNIIIECQSTVTDNWKIIDNVIYTRFSLTDYTGHVFKGDICIVIDNIDALRSAISHPQVTRIVTYLSTDKMRNPTYYDDFIELLSTFTGCVLLTLDMDVNWLNDDLANTAKSYIDKLIIANNITNLQSYVPFSDVSVFDSNTSIAEYNIPCSIEESIMVSNHIINNRRAIKSARNV